MNRSKSCEELLVRMVGFDTVNAAISGRTAPESALADFLATYAGQLGFAVTRLPLDGPAFNVLVAYAVKVGAPWLLFESHLDTVSADNMTIDPFSGRISEGRVFGRGACDTKSSGAAMLTALTTYRNGAQQPNNVAILYTVDEEIGKTGIRAFVGQQLQTLDFKPAGAIVGEPTGLHPVVAHNGVVRWVIRTQGVAAHSSDPGKGRSAISMMVPVIQAMESQYIPGLSASHPLTGRAACSINVIRGGTQVNIIPDACFIEVDRRVVPGENPKDVLPAVERLLDGLRQSDPGLRVHQEPPFVDSPLDARGNEAFIAFVQSVLSAMSLPHEARGGAFGTDASSFGEAGIPAVVLGPGSIEQAHAENEWIALDQLQSAVDVYLHLMCQPLENAV
ncbi:MAG: M20 family metallopeptidase [Phycisphaerae bacterium]|jgi:acetylornithine deacetylase|nr:M20 family metallopeptidase [Phycisphaerae bacterium]